MSQRPAAVLVTGAGSPTGRAVVSALSAAGHPVCAADADADVVQSLVDGPGPGVVLGVAGNSRDPAHQDDAVDYALEAFERIDALVNIVPPGAGAPSGWIYRVHLAWMAEHGGSVTNVYPAYRETVSSSTREVALRLGPRTRVTSVVVPAGVPGGDPRAHGLRTVPTCRTSDVVGLVLHLLATGTSELTGRTLVARATGGWSAVDGDPVF